MGPWLLLRENIRMVENGAAAGSIVLRVARGVGVAVRGLFAFASFKIRTAVT